MSEMNLERYVTEKEVSKVTGLKLTTLRKHRFYKKGIPYSKIGKCVRYHLRDVYGFMEANKVFPEIRSKADE